MMIPTILGNISEQAEKDFAIKIHGWMNARHNFVLLISAVVSLAASGLLLNLSGFDAAALHQDNASSLQIIRYIFALGTSAVLVLLFLLTFRTNKYTNAV
jgi:Na+/melibiose symporter-like transporter